MRIALVHDYLLYYGGAEKTLQVLNKMYPDAPIYTLLFDKQKMRRFFPNADIKASFLQNFPLFLRKRHKYLLPFYPSAIESFDLSEFDIVISSSSAFAKGVIVKPQTIHISYIHAPMRFVWDYYGNYLGEQKLMFAKSWLTKLIVHYLRIWDTSSSGRTDLFVANSKATAERVMKFYKQKAKVIYPPARSIVFSREEEIGGRSNIKPDKEPYFLIVSRLTPYKRVDIAISAFNKLELPLVIVGDGPDRKRLERMSGPNIKFAGFVDDEKLKQYYQNCQAFIFPQEEDFGITAVEAMIFGKPVLAYRKGGALETVKEGKNGEFFDDQTPEVLADGVRRIRENIKKYNPLEIKKSTEKFSEERFMEEFKKVVEFAAKKLKSEA